LEFGPDRRRPGLRLQPPRIGEHNAEVLSKARFSGNEIAQLDQTGVIATPSAGG
jgi:crotonobetainyl-CoA:carnitine CoA-transferase CaiB-like acyl-CoA transferase